MPNFDLYCVCSCGDVAGPGPFRGEYLPCENCGNTEMCNTQLEVLYKIRDSVWWNPFTWGTFHYETRSISCARLDEKCGAK